MARGGCSSLFFVINETNGGTNEGAEGAGNIVALAEQLISKRGIVSEMGEIKHSPALLQRSVSRFKV